MEDEARQWLEHVAKRLERFSRERDEELRIQEEQRNLTDRNLELLRREGRALWDRIERGLRERAGALNKRLGYRVFDVRSGILEGSPLELKISSRPIPDSEERGQGVTIRYHSEKGIGVDDTAFYQFSVKNLEQEVVEIIDESGNQITDTAFLCEKLLEQLLP